MDIGCWDILFVSFCFGVILGLEQSVLNIFSSCSGVGWRVGDWCQRSRGKGKWAWGVCPLCNDPLSVPHIVVLSMP